MFILRRVVVLFFLFCGCSVIAENSSLINTSKNIVGNENDLSIIRTVSTRNFEINLHKKLSSKKIIQIASAVDAHFKYNFGIEKFSTNSRIVIYVLMDGDERLKNPEITNDHPYFVYLSETSTIYAFCKSDILKNDFQIAYMLSDLTLSTLQNRIKNKVEAGMKIPLWLSCAIAKEAQFYQKNGLVAAWSRQSKKTNPLAPDDFLIEDDLKRINDLAFLQNTFWFYRFLRFEYREQIERNAWLMLVLSGKMDVKKLFPDKFKNSKDLKKESKIWWSLIYFSFPDNYAPVVLSMKESNTFIEELLKIPVKKDGKVILVPNIELISQINDPGIKKQFKEKQLLVIDNLSRINPVWTNTLVEYGTFLELLFKEKREFSIEKIQKQWGNLQKEREKAYELQKEIFNLLDGTTFFNKNIKNTCK